jgi:adenine-specific DNA-methyltransferase
MAQKGKKPKPPSAEDYRHDEQESLLRPDAGLQVQFKKKKPPKTYRYDSSLDPELSWDINADREQAEALISKIISASSLDEARFAGEQLKRMSSPSLNWAGKAERREFTVPTLPLFVHERLSTKAILESVKKRRIQMQLFADPELDITDRVLGAYEHETGWVNRLILGDNLQVMNSLLEYEGLGGQVQMIYMDPPYGVKFGSNFQPFIRKREVKHNEDRDFTREPEMVQAYRDTWELSLHSYLTYLRDRFKVAQQLLHPTGSIFVQISDENVHHVREVMDEVFDKENFCGLIAFRKTGGLQRALLPSIVDYLLWYAKDKLRIKFHQIYAKKRPGDFGATQYKYIFSDSGKLTELTPLELLTADPNRVFTHGDLTSQGNPIVEFKYSGQIFADRYKTTPEGLQRLADAGRVLQIGNTLRYVRYLKDSPYTPINEFWHDTGISGFEERKLYVVQTSPEVIERCVWMTTDPGDLVLDPTCGGGTTAYCAEKWGRRWIIIDVSRVPVALTRQRLLTATYSWYDMRDESVGLSGGFKYERKQNSKGEEDGGIVPHITLESIAKNEKPKEEVLVDKPNINPGIVRVTGPFVIEATIPTPVDIEADGKEDSGVEIGDYYQRLFLALRQVPRLHLPGNQIVEFKNVREISGSLRLQAEAVSKDNGDKLVAFAFGPPSSAISEKQVFDAAREAYARSYTHLYVLGFACQDTATRFIREAIQVVGIPASFVNVTMDIQMGDLLKNQRSSQIFSITGSPEVRLTRLQQKGDKGETLYQMELLGVDTFDPVKAEVNHLHGDNVPCWLLDTDYNDLSFKVCQAFFPRTSAWDNIQRSLKSQFDDSVWEHLRGTVSEPFSVGDNEKIAVKVIDDRGNELLLVKLLSEAEVEEPGK